MGEAQGSCFGRGPLAAGVSARRPGLRRGPSSPAGAPASPRPLSGGERRGMRVFSPRASPRSRECVSKLWGWGGGAVCRQPLPPGVLESGLARRRSSASGFPAGRGETPLAEDIPGAPPAPTIPGRIWCCFLSREVAPEDRGGRGCLGLFLLEASRFESYRLRGDLRYPVSPESPRSRCQGPFSPTEVASLPLEGVLVKTGLQL